MLFGSSFGERLEPVGDVCDSVFHCPGFHTFGDLVGGLPVKCDTVVNAVHYLFVAVCVKVSVHFLAVEDQFSEIVGDLARRGFDSRCLLLEGLLYYVKSHLAHNS